MYDIKTTRELDNLFEAENLEEGWIMSKIDKIRHNRTTTMLLSQECYMNDGSDQLKMEVKAALNYML